MLIVKKKPTRPKKKGKISVKQKAEIRKKKAEQDSVRRARASVRDNGISFKIKVKKK